MKLSISIFSLVLSTIVSSSSLPFSLGGAQKTLGDGEAVPGNNPLKFCKKDHGDDLLVLEKVDLTPNPPVKYVPVLKPYCAKLTFVQRFYPDD